MNPTPQSSPPYNGQSVILSEPKNPSPQSSPPSQGGVSRSDEGVLPTQHSELSTQNFSPCVIPAQLVLSEVKGAGIQSSPKNSELESVQSAESVVSPIPAAQKAIDDFDFYPRWDSVVLDLVGYPSAKRRKMTKQEREEAADQVLVNLKDQKQFLLDYNLITAKTKNEPIFPC